MFILISDSNSDATQGVSTDDIYEFPVEILDEPFEFDELANIDTELFHQAQEEAGFKHFMSQIDPDNDYMPPHMRRFYDSIGECPPTGAFPPSPIARPPVQPPIQSENLMDIAPTQGYEQTDEEIDQGIIAAMETEHRSYVNSKKNPTTTKGQLSNRNRFQKYLDSVNEKRSMISLRPALLDQYIAGWLLNYKTFKKVDGVRVAMNPEPGTLMTYFRGLCGYLKENKYPHDIARDKENFSMTHNIIKSRSKDLKSQGMGNLPNKARLIEDEEEERMWESGALGDHEPETLLSTVYYLTTKNLGFRGNHEAHQLCNGDFKKVNLGFLIKMRQGFRLNIKLRIYVENKYPRTLWDQI